jgi:hypothetical protein
MLQPERLIQKVIQTLEDLVRKVGATPIECTELGVSNPLGEETSPYGQDSAQVL